MKNIVYIYIIILFTFLLSTSLLFSFNERNKKIDSILTIIKKSKIDTNKVNLFLDLAEISFDISYDEYYRNSDSALKVAQIIKWDIGTAKSYTNIAIYFMETEKYQQAIENLKRALVIYEKNNHKEKQAKIYTALGNLYETIGEYAVSLDYHLKSLKINKLLNRKDGLSINLSNIGLVYWALNDDTLALKYFNEALNIDKKLNRKSGIAANFSNIGMVYQKWLNDSLANLNFTNALNIYYETKDEYGQALNHRNIGIIFSNYGNFDSAYYHLNKSYNLEMKLNNKMGIGETLSRFGILEYAITVDSIRLKISENSKYFKSKEYHYKKALQYIDSTITIFNELKSLTGNITLYRLKSQIYSEMQNFKSAFENYKNYSELKDSIYSFENSTKINSLEIKYQTELKNQEIEKLNQERKNQIYLLIAGLSIIFIAFIISFIRFREKKKLSEKLSQKNIEIESQKSLLEEKNTEIVDSIHYAATLQNALLPWSSVLNKSLKEHFVIYKPKDIVSGDSYWFKEVDGIKYLAVIDCTGHGVPGSMLTVIANSVLDDAVLSKKLTSTSDILTYMNEKVTEVLNQRLAENSIRDGMEVGLLAISNNKIQFSGAGRPLYLKNGTFETLKTDKRGIAGQCENDKYQFSSVEIEKSENMTLYLTSDGFADQMNEQSKKYSNKKFMETLDKISDLPMDKQKKIIENEFNSHRGNREQIDDVTIIGVKL